MEEGVWITACDTSACVEVLQDQDVILVRGIAPVSVEFTKREWREFVTGVKEGRFDV